MYPSISAPPSSVGALAFSQARTSSRNAFSGSLRSKSTSIPYPRLMQQQAGLVPRDGSGVGKGTGWPPNPYRPPVVTQWAPPFETARFRASMTTVFLIANAIALGLGILWTVLNIAYIQTPNPDQAFTAVWGVLALAYLALLFGTLIPAGVFFSMWVHRVVRNMPALGSPDWRRSPGWSVGSSFIPILSLFYPYWAVLDAWRASDPRWRWLNRPARKALGVPPLPAAWWALYLAALVTSRVASVMDRSQDLGTRVAGSAVDIAASVVLIGAAALAIFVVRDLTTRQEHKNALIAGGQLV